MADQRGGGIAWCDQTWNPIRGCSRVSEGCRNCYAEAVASRFSGPGQPYEGLARNGKWTGEVRLVEEHLKDPLGWKRPRRVFVNSMSDLFHERVPDAWVDRIFAVMALAPSHQFQVLTKRPERMLAYAADLAAPRRIATGDMGADWPPWPLPNVWLGVSVEDQKTADERIPLLLATQAAVRWVSYEPALEQVAFRWWLHDSEHRPSFIDQVSSLDWLVVGGESGPGARPFDLAWARSAVTQCRNAGVSVFVKQLGSRPMTRGETLNPKALRLRDRKGDDMSEWPEDLRVREYPDVVG